jgi:hypothetical protein
MHSRLRAAPWRSRQPWLRPSRIAPKLNLPEGTRQVNEACHDDAGSGVLTQVFESVDNGADWTALGAPLAGRPRPRHDPSNA